MNNNTTLLKGSMLVALSGVLYGFLGYLGTNVLQDQLSISDMLFWRFLVAGVWMAFFTFKKYTLSQIFSIDHRIIIFMLLLGAIGYATSSAFYFEASLFAGTGLAMVIFFSYPIMIALVSWVFDRTFNWITLLALILILVGLVLLRGPVSHPINLLGIFFGILAAVGYAFYIIGSKQFSHVPVDSNLLTFLVCFGCVVVLFIFSLADGTLMYPNTFKSIINLLLLGVVATAIPIQLMLEGLKYISSVRAAIISVLEPLVTVFCGIMLLQEQITHWQLLGAFIILCSALMIQFQRRL